MMKNCYSIVVKFSILEREKIGRDEFSRKLLEEEKKTKMSRKQKQKQKTKKRKKKKKKWSSQVNERGWKMEDEMEISRKGGKMKVKRSLKIIAQDLIWSVRG